MIVMKLKKKKQTKIYICTCMYNILLIYQIGVDVSTHPMVLSVPVQFSLTQQTHTHMHYEIVPRCTHTCASKRARAPHVFTQTHIRTILSANVYECARCSISNFISLFSRCGTINQSAKIEKKTFKHKIVAIHATSQSQCREMVPNFCLEKKTTTTTNNNLLGKISICKQNRFF